MNVDMKSILVLAVSAGIVFFVLAKKMPVQAPKKPDVRTPEEIALANMLTGTEYI